MGVGVFVVGGGATDVLRAVKMGISKEGGWVYQREKWVCHRKMGVSQCQNRGLN